MDPMDHDPINKSWGIYVQFPTSMMEEDYLEVKSLRNLYSFPHIEDR